MIESIEFTNYKALRDTTLPLAPFTLLLGPNGSGKTSVLQALVGLAEIVLTYHEPLERGKDVGIVRAVWRPTPNIAGLDAPVRICLKLRDVDGEGKVLFIWPPAANAIEIKQEIHSISPARKELFKNLASMRIYTLDPAAIAQPVAVTSEPLHWNGAGLAAVLDDIKDNYPERWDSLLTEMREWLPEFDHIQFVKPAGGQKAVALRTKRGGHQIPAAELSQGTLVALALLTLAYLPNPPSLIGLEEIDRGLHPRLLRHLQDALYRLAYPESCGEKRPAIQVIATTHSPYLLDLYRDHPDKVVIAQKEGLDVKMQRLSDIEHFHEILGDSPLSEVWYSGVFGGVTVKP